MKKRGRHRVDTVICGTKEDSRLCRWPRSWGIAKGVINGCRETAIVTPSTVLVVRVQRRQSSSTSCSTVPGTCQRLIHEAEPSFQQRRCAMLSCACMYSGNAYGHARVKKGWMTGRKPNLDAYSKTNPATGSASIQHPLSEKKKKTTEIPICAVRTYSTG